MLQSLQCAHHRAYYKEQVLRTSDSSRSRSFCQALHGCAVTWGQEKLQQLWVPDSDAAATIVTARRPQIRQQGVKLLCVCWHYPHGSCPNARRRLWFDFQVCVDICVTEERATLGRRCPPGGLEVSVGDMMLE